MSLERPGIGKVKRVDLLLIARVISGLLKGVGDKFHWGKE
jgi:hypothetical protein